MNVRVMSLQRMKADERGRYEQQQITHLGCRLLPNLFLFATSCLIVFWKVLLTTDPLWLL